MTGRAFADLAGAIDQHVSTDRAAELLAAYREEVLRDAAPKLRAALREMPAAARERHEEGMLRAALILEEMGIVAGDPR